MRFMLLLLGIIVGAAWIGTSAQAQNYPWCAVLSMGDVAYNCGFDTEAQCQASVNGIGGFCQRNTQYVPPAPAPVSLPRAQSPSPH